MCQNLLLVLYAYYSRVRRITMNRREGRSIVMNWVGACGQDQLDAVQRPRSNALDHRPAFS
jgi:hypothetical protein